MDRIEEELWNYIDGDCTAEEQLVIAGKIATDLQYQKIYEELLEVDHQLMTLDLEEPSLSFTRNVMEKVRAELPPVALKTKIDNRIIYAIWGVFVACILTVLAYAISNSSFTFQLPKFAVDFSKVLTPITVQVFVLVDVALGLVYLDSYLRKKRNVQHEAKINGSKL